MRSRFILELVKELDWVHIRDNVAFILLFWPFFATAYWLILEIIPWLDFISFGIFAATCFFLGAFTPALIIGKIAPSSKKRALHSFVATFISMSIVWSLVAATLNYLTSLSD